MTRIPLRPLMLALALAVGAAQHAQATLIAADSYLTGSPANPALGQYTPDVGLNAANPTISPGWTGSGSAAWSVGSANIQATTLTLTNSAITYPTGGKGRYISSATDAYRAGHHKMDTYTPVDTYYMSFLVNPGSAFGATGGRQNAVVGFTNFFDTNTFRGIGAGNLFGLLTGFTGGAGSGATQQADLILRARGLGGLPVNTVLLPNVANETYHVLFKLDINVGGGVTDNVTYWVNPSDLTSEATMTATAIATGLVATAAMDINSRIDRSFVVVDTYNRSFFWDETRLGTALNDVTGVPEPGSLVLAGLGVLGAALGAWRRRRAA